MLKIVKKITNAMLAVVFKNLACFIWASFWSFSYFSSDCLFKCSGWTFLTPSSIAYKKWQCSMCTVIVQPRHEIPPFCWNQNKNHPTLAHFFVKTKCCLDLLFSRNMQFNKLRPIWFWVKTFYNIHPRIRAFIGGCQRARIDRGSRPLAATNESTNPRVDVV